MATKARVLRTMSWTWKDAPTGSTHYEVKSNTDTVTAEFHRIRPPFLTVTPMKVVKARFNPKGYPPKKGGSGVRPITQYYTVYGGTRYLQPEAGDLDAASARASRRFYSELNLGETLGSTRETVRMIGRRFMQLATFFVNVRKHGSKVAARMAGFPDRSSLNTRSASQAYLEYLFGWRQLAQDIWNGLDELERTAAVGMRISHRGFSGVQASSFNQRIGTQVTLSGYVRNANLRRLNELGLANPARTAWELTRLSFLVDWITHTNLVLGYYTWSLGLNQTERCVVTSDASLSYRGPSAAGPWYDASITTRINRYREPLSIGWIGLGIQPVTQNSLSQGVTAAALLGSFLGPISGRNVR